MGYKEFIARLYFITTVETGKHFILSDLSIVLECEMTLEEFDKWLDDENEKETFEKWLEENGFTNTWRNQGKALKIKSQYSIGDTVFVVIDSTDTPYIKKDQIIAFEVWLKNSAETLFVRTLSGLYSEKQMHSTERNAKIAIEQLTTTGKPTIDDLDLSVRSHCCLKCAGITTLEELKSMTDNDFSKIKNLNQKCVDEIKVKLKKGGEKI